MFSKAALFIASALAVAAVAAPGGPPAAGTCNTGPVQCCNSVQSTENNNPLQLLLGLVGAVVHGVTANVGVTCSGVKIIGTGGTNCNAQTVCCQNNSFNGIVALGCTPININA